MDTLPSKWARLLCVKVEACEKNRMYKPMEKQKLGCATNLSGILLNH